MPEEERPIETLRNIGAKSALALKTVDIHTIGQLEELGVVEAFLRLRAAGFNPSKVFLWSMAAGLVDISHTELPAEVKDMLNRQLQDMEQAEGGAQLPLEGIDDDQTGVD